jgi:putative endonuclease
MGEELAARFLRDGGYRILATNYRCNFGEVDIIAQDGRVLAFIEVRTRRSRQFGAAEESLTAAKRKHLVAACQDYIQRHGDGDVEWRIDLVCVYLDRTGDVDRINHLRHAVQL